MPVPARRRLGEVLVEACVLSPEQLDDCLAIQAAQPRPDRQRLGSIVIGQGVASERDVAMALSRVLNVPMVDLAAAVIDADAARAVPRAVAERYAVIGLSLDAGQLRLAMADPTDVVALDDVRLYTGARSVLPVVSTEAAIRMHLNRVWSLEEDASDIVGMVDGVGTDVLDDAANADIDDTPVVRLANVILQDATRANASDIHLEPGARDLRVRYRVDGLLRDVMTLPRAIQSSLVSRVKIMSGLDIAERRRPQDGRARLVCDEITVDARVSTLPGMHGEKVVIRLLSRREGVVPLSRIGLSEQQLESFLETVIAPQGLVLITGPTGSGKTSTLYSAVSQLRTPERNIVTLEDPVEIELSGITQVQVNEKSGLTFARGLRSVLRQDPDVVLVGEVRDTDTAELAMRASLTGHLVFTTLHTNDASAAVTRLVDMGVEPYLIASSLAMVVAQRLVRRPCANCAAPYQPSPRTLQLLGLVEDDVAHGRLVRGRGCDDCGGTGYRGRTAIFEVLPVDAAMRAVLTNRPTESAIRAAARAMGVPALRTDGIVKAMRGETTLEEVLRVTQVDAVNGPRCHNCRRGLEADMTYCPWCAAVVESTGCLGCNKPLEPEWRVCPWCRTPTDSAGFDSAGTAAAGTPDRRARVLVVDDDPSVVQFAKVALIDTCEVITAGTAEEALRLCATADIDAIVLDLVLPDLSGIEVTRLLRSDTRTALLPLMLITGSDDLHLRTEALHAGADDYVSKPIDPGDLEARVQALLARSRLAPTI